MHTAHSTPWRRLVGALTAFVVLAATAVGFAVPASAADATLTVTPSGELHPDGQEITITGSNYPVSDLGVYVQVGWIAENWRPSQGAQSSARTNAYNAWYAVVAKGCQHMD